MRRSLLILLVLSLPLHAQVPPFKMDLRWDIPSDTLTLFVVGDIMSHGNVRKSAEEHGYGSFFKHIEAQIQGADLAVGNMEFPLAGAPTAAIRFSRAPILSRRISVRSALTCS